MFHTVLFDIDGVLLSEERYFDASALTIYELLASPQYLGLSIKDLPAFSVQPTEQQIRQIRRVVFAKDDVLQTMKARGVNANWDMVYLQTGYVLATYLKSAIMEHQTINSEFVVNCTQSGWTIETLQVLGNALRESTGEPFPNVFSGYSDVFELAESKLDLFNELDTYLMDKIGMHRVSPMSSERILWDVGQRCFQEWYLGDDYVSEVQKSGKKGFLLDEVPLVTPNAFSALLERLASEQFTFGIATGRPAIETRVPLTELGWMQWFAESRVSTASDVLIAEAEHSAFAPLSKPHPYSYLRSFLNSPSPAEVLAHPLPLNSNIGRHVLIVGDSVADLLAAQRMGCMFAAVLTGLDGAKARDSFASLGADFIVEDVLGVEEILFGHSL